MKRLAERGLVADSATRHKRGTPKNYFLNLFINIAIFASILSSGAFRLAFSILVAGCDLSFSFCSDVFATPLPNGSVFKHSLSFQTMQASGL
jgi:hypothetical protein